MKKIIVLLLLSIVICGCDSKDAADTGDGQKVSLLMYSGAGLRPAVQEAADTYAAKNNITIDVDYAGSEVLLNKLKLAEQGDLYMPGDKSYIQQAADVGVILSDTTICYFIPTILVAKGNPKGIGQLSDLLRPGLKIGLGNPKACAIGRKSKKIFAKNGIDYSLLADNLKYSSLTVNELGMQIKAGSLDAVIVWDAIASFYSDVAQEVAIPVEKNIISTVNIGVLSFTKHRQLAEGFTEFVQSPSGQAIFKKHSYRTDPPK